MLNPELLFAIVITSISGLVWLVRLEGKIKLVEAQFKDILARLERIEYLIIRFNGS